MKLIYNFIIVIFLLLNFTLLSAEDKIVYIDLDIVMNLSRFVTNATPHVYVAV